MKPNESPISPPVGPNPTPPIVPPRPGQPPPTQPTPAVKHLPLGERLKEGIISDGEGGTMTIRQWKEYQRLQRAAKLPTPSHEQTQKAQKALKEQGFVSSEDL
jgi:hypothetical protein